MFCLFSLGRLGRGIVPQTCCSTGESAANYPTITTTAQQPTTAGATNASSTVLTGLLAQPSLLYVASYAFNLAHGTVQGVHGNNHEYLTKLSMTSLGDAAAQDEDDSVRRLFTCCFSGDLAGQCPVDRGVEVLPCPLGPYSSRCWITVCEEIKLHLLRHVPYQSNLLFVETDMIWYGTPRVFINKPHCDVTLFFKKKHSTTFEVNSVNTGVISITKTKATVALMENWLALTAGLEQSKYGCIGGGNQMVVRHLLNLTDNFMPRRKAHIAPTGARICGEPYTFRIAEWSKGDPTQDMCRAPNSVVMHLKGANRHGHLDGRVELLRKCVGTHVH